MVLDRGYRRSARRAVFSPVRSLEGGPAGEGLSGGVDDRFAGRKTYLPSGGRHDAALFDVEIERPFASGELRKCRGGHLSGAGFRVEGAGGGISRLASGNIEIEDDDSARRACECRIHAGAASDVE